VGLEGGRDRVEARDYWRELCQEILGRLEARFVEFPQDVHVIAAVHVLAEHLRVIHQLHQAITLLTLGDELGQPGHDLAVRPIQSVTLRKRPPKGGGLASWVRDLRLGIETKQRDDVVHESGWVARVSAEGVSGRVSEAAAGKAEHEMSRFFFGSGFGQALVPYQFSQKGVLSGVGVFCRRSGN